MEFGTEHYKKLPLPVHTVKTWQLSVGHRTHIILVFNRNPREMTIVPLIPILPILPLELNRIRSLPRSFPGASCSSLDPAAPAPTSCILGSGQTRAAWDGPVLPPAARGGPVVLLPLPPAARGGPVLGDRGRTRATRGGRGRRPDQDRTGRSGPAAYHAPHGEPGAGAWTRGRTGRSGCRPADPGVAASRPQGAANCCAEGRIFWSIANGASTILERDFS